MFNFSGNIDTFFWHYVDKVDIFLLNLSYIQQVVLAFFKHKLKQTKCNMKNKESSGEECIITKEYHL